jgi:hypothetical protein
MPARAALCDVGVVIDVNHDSDLLGKGDQETDLGALDRRARQMTPPEHATGRGSVGEDGQVSGRPARVRSVADRPPQRDRSAVPTHREGAYTLQVMVRLQHRRR